MGWKGIIFAAALIAAPALGQDEAPAPPPPEVWTCNAEMVCQSNQRQSLEIRDAAWLSGDRRDERDLMIDDDIALLKERLGKMARFRFPDDPRRQDFYITDVLDRTERRLLDDVLGIQRKPVHRVGGGLPVLVASAPFIAQIRYRDSLTTRQLPGFADTRTFGVRWESRHRCGGTQIAHDWVLTAAHCVNPDEIKAGLAVQLGVTDISTSQGLQVNVESAVIHGGYDHRNIYFNDVALLHLAPDNRPRDPRKMAIAPLYPAPLGSDVKVHAAGWGRINDDPRAQVNATALLRRVEMTTLANPKCASQPGYGPTPVEVSAGIKMLVPRVHPRVICVYGDNVKTCNGDSGGPLYYSPFGASGRNVAQLVGIVSWNKQGCHVNSDDSPGVYTRVQPYLSWIKQAMELRLKPGETRRLPE